MSGVDAAPYACATFLSNFPEASFFLSEIKDISGHHLLRDANLRRGELDCLIGGPPCQSFSFNNHQRSSSHHRSKLFRDYLRIVEIVRPKYIVMENVPGILTIGAGSVVRAIRNSLKRLGYKCEARILYAEDFGVPQERRRVFIVGTRCGSAANLFPAGSHGPAKKPKLSSAALIHRSHTKKPKKLTRVWDAIGDLPRIKSGGGKEVARYNKSTRTTYQRQLRTSNRSRLFNHVSPALTKLNLQRISNVPEGGNWRDIPRRLLPAGMKRARLSDHTKRYGRLKRNGLSCTLLTKCDPHWGSYIHPTQNRAISVREAARLQSFPDSFVFRGPVSKQYIQVGNAVPPLMAEALARAGLKHLKAYEKRKLRRRAKVSRREMRIPRDVMTDHRERAALQQLKAA